MNLNSLSSKNPNISKIGSMNKMKNGNMNMDSMRRTIMG